MESACETETLLRRVDELEAELAEKIETLWELDRYRERYEQLREVLIDALGPQSDTIISLVVKPFGASEIK